MNINIGLNTKDINRAIRQLDDYIIELQRKSVEFVSQLSEVGISVARANTLVEYNEQYVNMGDLLEFSKDVVVNGGLTTCTITVTAQVYTKDWEGGSAQVNPLLMAEFGSGAQAIDGHRGTFPNQHVAFLDSWEWVSDGQKHESSGSVPSRPLFKAKQEMEQQIQDVAIRVYKA